MSVLNTEVPISGRLNSIHLPTYSLSIIQTSILLYLTYGNIMCSSCKEKIEVKYNTAETLQKKKDLKFVVLLTGTYKTVHLSMWSLILIYV